jgi:two-component sensor histidine kinase/integral membrane sensor domain MASE1
MRHRPAVATLALIVLLVAVYILAGTLGLWLAVLHPSVTAVWPPTGIALAAGLLLGYRIWPGILLGAFLVNLIASESGPTSLGIAFGNTLEALLGTYLVSRYARGRDAFERVYDIFRFVLLAGGTSSAVSATIGVSSLALGGFAPWADYGDLWVTWWLGDAMGALIVTPLVLSWSNNRRWHWNRRQTIEAMLMLPAVGLVGLLVFGGLLPAALQHQPLEFTCIPLLIWMAFRFGPREATTATVVLAGIAIGGTLAGFGPFARSTPHTSLLLLQTFLGVVTITIMVLAAAVSERQRAEEALRQSEEHLRLALHAGQMGTWDWDMLRGELHWSETLEAIHGLAPGTFAGTLEAYLADVHPDDDALVRQSIAQTIADGREHLVVYRIVLPDERIRWVEGRGRLFYDETGRGVRMRGVRMDITMRMQAEEHLKASLREKDVLLKEIHHRVKNNLQIISSLLNLQASSIQDPKALALFAECQHRISSMALIHQSLYQAGDLSRIDFAAYLRTLAVDLFRAYAVNPARITLTTTAEALLLSLDAAVPCGLLVNELLTNSLKHAFPQGGAGQIQIELHRLTEEQIVLKVCDTGVGLPAGVDLQKTNSFGLQLVRILAGQLHATIDLARHPGTTYTITFAEPTYNGPGVTTIPG